MLRAAACVENFDIITLTETWIDKSGKIFSPKVRIDGYALFHMDRKTGNVEK